MIALERATRSHPPRHPAPVSDEDVRLLGPFEVPGLPGRRHVRLYLPPSAQAGGGRSGGGLPVLYMFDGQNVFGDGPSYAGGWHLHRAVAKLPAQNRMAVVGIDHGGERRVHELSPFRCRQSEGKLDLLLDWLDAEIVPMMAREFGLAERASRVRVGGSSLGGLAAAYALFSRPERFGGALAMSPSLWLDNARLLHAFSKLPGASPAKGRRLYVDAGALEGGGQMLALAERLADALGRRGWGEDDLLFRAFKRGRHCEAHWRRRAPSALRFLFGSGPGAEGGARRDRGCPGASPSDVHADLAAPG